MQVGIHFNFQNHLDYPDAEMFRTELALAVEAEAMGYDFVGLVEHHFTDYAMCPDNAQALSWIAARTSRIKLMTAAFILPWNDPLRVVEKTVMLDIVSEGRVILGMGRGLARTEFAGFGRDMAESRERFDQAARIILDGLESGWVEADTPFYKQPRVEVRPRPERSFRGRSYMVGMSPASVEVAARLGLGCFKFSQGPWDGAVPELEAYYRLFEELNGRPAPRIIVADLLSCAESDETAMARARRYMRAYFDGVTAHYEFRGEHFARTSGYDSYAAAAEQLRQIAEEDVLDGFIAGNLVGSPERILEVHERRKALIGDYDLTLNLTYGSMPYDEVWQQTKLFADKVLPTLKG
jgi:alkanesulfonate monooxygenase SsuD/methylene tetrahydromethanopterin reductase-like flavin-dependent oxidoreductase (luciferase family)